MQSGQRQRANGCGFTLVELLVAVVVVGVLTGIAIISMNGLTDQGANAACVSTMNAANAANVTYFALTGKYPQTFANLTNPPSGQPLLDSSAGLIEAPTTLKGKGGWTLILQPGATAADRTTFTGC